MLNLINDLKNKLADFRYNWQIQEVPGMIVSNVSLYGLSRREIPFTLYVRRGRFSKIKTQFNIIEWAEKVVSDVEPSVDMEVRLQGADAREGATILRRVNKSEIVVTHGNLEIYTHEWIRMGLGNLTLKVA